ncbi:DUF969 domain-containing protein [Austwickia chelonae]|uniref:DUF969 domain-containing protein n=1 Tax=Austwickia chelonae TaxID=100225 RepID=UPI000E24B854|nr:DUF969 domain-containing protein [Austwickia chelonae]
MWVLLAVVVVVVGFALRINSLLVVTVAGIVAGLLGRLSPMQILDTFGQGFASSRSVTVFVVTLPVIGLIERYGLQFQARALIGRLTKLSVGRLLMLYMLIRQITAAMGLVSIGGPAQSVRPLLYPMAEGAAEREHPRLTERMREKIKAFSASSDTVGLFFGEDIFIAIGSLLLITGFVDSTYGLSLEPIDLAKWAVPTGIAAFLIHGGRLLWLDRTLRRMSAEENEPRPAGAEAAATAAPEVIR